MDLLNTGYINRLMAEFYREKELHCQKRRPFMARRQFSKRIYAKGGETWPTSAEQGLFFLQLSPEVPMLFAPFGSTYPHPPVPSPKDNAGSDTTS